MPKRHLSVPRQRMTVEEALRRLPKLAASIEPHLRVIVEKLHATDADLAACVANLEAQARLARAGLQGVKRLSRRMNELRKRGSEVASKPMRYFLGRSTLTRILEILSRQDCRLRKHQEELFTSLDKIQEPLPLRRIKAEVDTATKAATSWDGKEVIATIEEHIKESNATIKLIGNIMSAKRDINKTCDKHFHEFQELLQRDYLDFSHEDDYPAEAKSHDKLDDIFLRMVEMRMAPRLASRNICAVAGGFSSGKSSLLNSLIVGEGILPTDINPTTSIPTYIFHIDNEQAINDGVTINVFNHAGGDTRVDVDTFQTMTHNFEKEHGITLKQIVDRVAIYTPNLMKWKEIALVDTPGHTNPGVGQHANRDEEIARQSVRDSDFMIWVVDCANGTLKKDDIKFIRDVFLSRLDLRIKADSHPIYIVLNKAEKYPPDQRRAILETVVKEAEKNSIPYYGIGLYSSHENKWYEKDGRSLDTFLTMINQTEPTYSLVDEIAAIFDGYIQHNKVALGLFKDIFRLMKYADVELTQVQEMQEGELVRDMRRHRVFAEERLMHHEKQAERARSLQTDFKRCTIAFMEEIQAMQNVV